MSFWSGVVQGVKDIDVLKEKEALADERQGVRDEATARYNATTDRQDRMEALQATQYATAQARLDAKDAVEAEDRYLEQGLAIIKLGGSAFGSALTGGGGDVNAGNVISAGGMNSAVLGMTAELEAAGGMDKLDDTSKEWFNTVLANPDAAAGILAFAHAQREEGNDLSITELPKIIQLAGTMEAAGEEAYLDFKERFVAGNVDMKDPDQYLAGMQALMQYKPAQVVWGQVQAVDSPATKKMDFETWRTNTATIARVALMNMEDGTEKDDLLSTLSNAAKTGSEHELTRGEAFVSLWDKYGRQAADELGLDKTNPHMRPYFAIMSNESPEGAFTSPTAPEAPVVPETSGMGSVGAPVEPQATPTPAPLSFDTEEEARAYIEAMTPEAFEALAQVPFIVVAGAKRPNKRYVGNPDVPTEAPVGLGGEEPEVMPDTRSEGYRPTQMGATELNLPKFLEGLSEDTRKSVEAELAVMPKQEVPTVAIEDLSPDDLAELEAGVEEVISAIVGSADQGDIEVLVRGLNDKFTADIVGVAMRMAMGSNQ